MSLTTPCNSLPCYRALEIVRLLLLLLLLFRSFRSFLRFKLCSVRRSPKIRFEFGVFGSVSVRFPSLVSMQVCRIYHLYRLGTACWSIAELKALVYKKYKRLALIPRWTAAGVIRFPVTLPITTLSLGRRMPVVNKSRSRVNDSLQRRLGTPKGCCNSQAQRGRMRLGVEWPSRRQRIRRRRVFHACVHSLADADSRICRRLFVHLKSAEEHRISELFTRNQHYDVLFQRIKTSTAAFTYLLNV